MVCNLRRGDGETKPQIAPRFAARGRYARVALVFAQARAPDSRCCKDGTRRTIGRSLHDRSHPQSLEYRDFSTLRLSGRSGRRHHRDHAEHIVQVPLTASARRKISSCEPL